MSIDPTTLGESLPGGGPTDKLGDVIVVPTGVLGASQTILSHACKLMGWSFREATGSGGAIAELLDGGDDNAGLIAALSVDMGADPAATQAPASQTTSAANAALAPSIGGVAGTLAFITSLRIDGLGATAGSVVAATLTGVQGGTITYEVTVPAGAGTAIVPVTDQFGGRGLQASAAGVAIALNVPAFGAGNTFAEASVRGYILQPASSPDTQWFGSDGLRVLSGVRVRIVSGSVRGSLWIRR